MIRHTLKYNEAENDAKNNDRKLKDVVFRHFPSRNRDSEMEYASQVYIATLSFVPMLPHYPSSWNGKINTQFTQLSLEYLLGI